MPTLELLQMLASLNPTTAQVSQVFWALGKMPPDVLRVLIKSLDEEMVRKLATWSKTFIRVVNDMGPDAIDPDVFRDSLQQMGCDEFLQVMEGTQFRGPKLTAESIAAASKVVTKAVKAKNWQEALWAGLSMAKMLPV